MATTKSKRPGREHSQSCLEPRLIRVAASPTNQPQPKRAKPKPPPPVEIEGEIEDGDSEESEGTSGAELEELAMDHDA
jgi:hypothetical protein